MEKFVSVRTMNLGMVRIIRLGVGVSTWVAKGAAHPFAKALE